MGIDDLELTPRRSEGWPIRRNRRYVAAGLLAALALAAGGIVWQGLDSAALYFRNADEAVAQRDELGDRRFRLQGVVVDGSVAARPPIVTFAVEFNSVSVDVEHEGDPPQLFQPGIPVVLEGRWDGDHFRSDRILVKHSSEYEAENPDRTGSYGESHSGS